jgi:cobalt-precorrin 5A hydrolase
MARTAVVAISRRGTALARSLTASLGGDAKLYVERRFHVEDPAFIGEGGGESVPFDLPVRPVLRRLFNECQQLVIFMPVGAAVRLLAPYLQDKRHDPAVVCVDDAGRFAVSLLSGHLGGADRLAEEVGQALGATAVVTSASHVTGTLAVDLLGYEFGWRMEAAPSAVTRASAAVVNGDPVGIFQEAGEPDWWPHDQPLPPNIKLYSSLEALAGSACVAALMITDRLCPSMEGRKGEFETRPYQTILSDKIVVLYRPRSLVAGIGCRRGVVRDELEELLTGTFSRHNLALASLGCIATADLKKDEPGIQELAEKFDVPLRCYTAAELNRVFDAQLPPSPPSPPFGTEGMGGFPHPGSKELRPTPSPVAHRLLGLWGVSEPAALLASGSDELLVPRVKTSRATIAVARMSFDQGQG